MKCKPNRRHQHILRHNDNNDDDDDNGQHMLALSGINIYGSMLTLMPMCTNFEINKRTSGLSFWLATNSKANSFYRLNEIIMYIWVFALFIHKIHNTQRVPWHSTNRASIDQKRARKKCVRESHTHGKTDEEKENFIRKKENTHRAIELERTRIRVRQRVGDRNRKRSYRFGTYGTLRMCVLRLFPLSAFLGPMEWEGEDGRTRKKRQNK